MSFFSARSTGTRDCSCPETVHLDAALWPHTQQGSSPNTARWQRSDKWGPAYLPVGLTGDPIGVAQNLQLHVRLKDPAAGREKQRVRDFQQERAGPPGKAWAATPAQPGKDPRARLCPARLQMGCPGRGWRLGGSPICRSESYTSSPIASLGCAGCF